MLSTLLLFAGSLNAAEIAKEGTIALGSTAGNANFGRSSASFQVTGLFDWGGGSPIAAGFLDPTTTAKVNAGMKLYSGTLIYQGTSYSIPNPISDQTGSIVSATLTGSPIAITGPGIFTGTFSGTGVLRRRVSQNPSAPFDVDTTWSGQGTVAITVTTNTIGTRTNYVVTSQVYTFAPEPSTYGMIGLALAGAIFLKRRQLLRRSE
jgi:hypothetical protein